MLRTLLTVAVVASLAAGIAAVVVARRDAVADADGPAPAPAAAPDRVPVPVSAAAMAARVEDGRLLVTGSGVAAKDADVGRARVMAERAAKLDALRNMIEALRGMTLEDGRVLGDVAGGDDKTTAALHGVVQTFRINDTRYYSDGSVDIDAALALDDVDAALAPLKVRR